MSQDTASSSTPSEPPAPAKKADEKPKRGRWRRRLFKTIFALVLFFVVIRVGVFFLLAMTLRKVANFYDLDLTYGRQEITVLGGDAGLWDVKVSRRGENKPFLEADYVHGNLSVMALLRTHIEIWRMEADGVRLDVTREADGKVPLLELVMAHLSGKSVANKPASNQPLELGSPFKIDALRLHRFRARISDLAVTPAFQDTLYADVRVSDLRNPEKPTSIEADVWSDEVLTALRFNGTGTAEGRVVKLDASFRGGGLNLGPVAQYLQPLGLNPVARSIDWAGTLKLSTDAGATPDSITANVRIADVTARADTKEVVAVQAIDIAAKSIDAKGVKLSDLAIDGVKVHAGRSTDGRLRFAGIELVPPPPATKPTKTHVELAPAAPAATSPVANRYFVTLDAFRLKDLQASFGDEALAQPTMLTLHIDELKTNAIARDANGRVVVPLTGTLRAPGIAEAIAIEGSIQPFEMPYELSASMTARHIRPDAIRPYLAPLGISSTLEDASLTGSLLIKARPTDTGGVDASFNVSKLVLQDAKTRLAMPLLSVDGVRIEPALASIVVNDAEIVGPELSASREADGTFRGAGLQFTPATATAQPAQQPATRPTTQLVELPVLPALPRIELKKLKWSGTKIELADNAASPARTFNLSDVGADLENLVIDLSSRPGESRDGKVNGYVSLPGLVNRFTVNGTFERVPNRTSFDVAVAGSGLTGGELAPYLAPLGVIPQLKDGSLALQLGVDLNLAAQRLSANLDVSDLSLKDGDAELAAIKSLRVEALEVADGAIASRSITIDSPSVWAKRLKDGALESGGVRLLPAKVDPLALPAPGPLLVVPYSPVPIRVGEVKVTNARAGWQDEAAFAPVSITLNADATMSNVALSLPGDPAAFTASGSIDSVAKRFSATGKLDVDPARVIFEGVIDASGITASAIDGYLPPGVKTTLSDASFKASVSASVLPVDETGQSLALSLRELQLEQQGQTLATVPALTVDVPLIDLEKNVIQIRSLMVERAAVANVKVMNDGTIHLPGLSVGLPPADAAPEPEAAPPAVAAAGAEQTEEQLAQQLAAARKPLPLVRIEKLDIGVESAGVQLEARGDAASIGVKDLHVVSAGPIQIGGAKAAELPPVTLKIQTELSPLVKQVDLDLIAAPFATEATFTGKLQANQIQGQGLLDLVPQLADLVDGSKLTEGSFHAGFDATLKVKRSRPTDFDLRRGFDGEVKLTDVQYRTDPSSDPVAGLESITLEGVRLNEAFAGGNVKLLTINKPLARVLRDAEGIHVLGWTIKLPAAGATTQAVVEGSVASAEDAKAQAAKPAVNDGSASSAPGPEFKIDKLVVTGGDVIVRDTSVEPALVVPINGLDVEVKGLSNRALVEERSIRFSALVSADKVELPTRAKRGEVVGAATEMRPLWSQVTTTGNLKLYPALDGYAKASVNGFEMQSLIGEAKAFGITLGDGIFDGVFDARFRDGGNLDLNAKLVTTDLALSEQENGLMQRTFKLPVPIDAAIDVVEDASGSITIPLKNIQVRSGEVSMGSVFGAAVGGVSNVVVTAIASAPVKGLQGIFGGGSAAAEPKPPIVLSFLPGDTSLEASLRAELDKLVLEMRKTPDLVVQLSHRLSNADAARSATLASPSPAQIEQMTALLRDRRIELINDRALLAANVSAELGSGGTSDDQLARLRDFDERIVSNDDALERLLELTRPGAELQAGRRTKATALDIASARLAAVRGYLDAAGTRERIAGFKDRVSVANPTFEVDAELPEGGTITIDQVVQKRAK